MSAITEYVHFYQKNYDKWGINRINTIKSDPSSVSFNQIRNQLSNESELSILLAEAKQIEKEYNDLFFPKVQTEFSKILLQAAQEVLNENFGAAAGTINSSNFDINKNELSMEYKSKVESVRKKIDVANLQQQATTKQILNTINKLTKVLLNFEDTKSTVIKARLQQAKEQLKQIKQKIQQETNIENLNFSLDIETINKLIQQFNRSFTWYNQRGDLFEWLLPLIQLKSVNLAGEELKETMKSVIKTGNVGNLSTSITLPDFVNINTENLNENINSKKIQMQIVNVRNKTDVIIKYQIGNGQYKDINVSAKSATNKHIKLVESTSLYRILVFSQNYDFIRHYLNIISWSNKGGKASENQIKEANKLVRSLIMQLAAQGFDLNNPAELLILHSIKDRQIKVYNIKALVYVIKNHIMSEDSKYDNIIRDFNNDYTIQQPFEDTVEKRLNYLINQINNKKISAYLNGTQLNDYIHLFD